MATQREQENAGTSKADSKKPGAGASAGMKGQRSSSYFRGRGDNATGGARRGSRRSKGDAQAENVRDADGVAEAEGDSEADDLDEVETIVSMLLGIAQMDSEAAFAYETAAELVDVADVRSRLLEFAGDHRRHITDLGKAIEQLGGDPAEAAAPPPETSVFALLTSSLGMVGPRAVLLGLIGNEEFTNSVYDTALDLISDPELRALIERNFEDEQRHITWLSTQARPSEEEEPLATGES